jgi:poly(3-hydroxybutyrate) depolymerase
MRSYSAMMRMALVLAVTAMACGSDAQAPDGGVVEEDAPGDAAERDSVGCRTGLGMAEGEHAFTYEGLARRFMLRLPTGYTRDRAWPVVLALHGNGGSVAYWDGTTGDRNIRGALAADAILVVLEARDGNWRDYALAPAEWPARLEAELRYIDEVVTRLRTDLCVRDDGLFAMGFSGGGSFSGVLACRRADIRAIAVGGAVMYVPAAECTRSVPAWITIGTMELEPARAEFRDMFKTLDGCAATSTATAPSPCVAFDGCAVHYCQHPAGHIWPAFGTPAMWEFFRAQLPPR